MRIATLRAAAVGAALSLAPASQAQTLVITGVVDGPLPGGLPKAIEVFATAAIPDLSRYGVGSANNADGTNGAEFVFPEQAATAGAFFYVAAVGDMTNNGIARFTEFFGFAPDFTNQAANINGDDSIELFYDGNDDGTFDAAEVIDVFGVVGVDGTGQPWEYLDGWAYRQDNTGPDGTTFVIANWRFSGVDALDGYATNASAPAPFPVRSYTRSGTAAEGAPASGLSMAVANPVRGAATVHFTTEAAEATLALYDALGRRVAVLADGATAGTQTATLATAGLAPGVYLLRLDAGGRSLTRTVSVVR